MYPNIIIDSHACMHIHVYIVSTIVVYQYYNRIYIYMDCVIYMTLESYLSCMHGRMLLFYYRSMKSSTICGNAAIRLAFSTSFHT